MANVTISHAKSNTIADWSGTVTVANSTGGTTTDQASNLIRPSDWNSNHVATIQLQAADIASLITVGGELSMSTSTNGVTVYENKNYVSFFEPIPPLAAATITFAPSVGSYYLDPFEVPDNLSGGHFNFFFANPATAFGGGTTITSNSTGSATKNQTNYHRFALYTQVSTNNTVFSQVWSTEYQVVMQDVLALTTGTGSWSASKSVYLTVPVAFDTTGGMTTSSYSTATTTQAVSSSTASSLVNAMVTGIANYVTGSVMQPVGVTNQLAGGVYWLAYGFSSTSNSAGTNYGQGAILGAQSILALSEANLQPYKRVGNTTTNISSTPVRLNGYFSTTSTAPPTTIGTNGVFASSTTANNRIYWNYEVLT